MKLEARLMHNSVLFDKDTDTHLVVSVTAPAANTENARPKLAIVLCFDVSGSMAGRKLEYAQQSAYKVIEHLKADDYLGIVTFGSQVTTITKPARVESNKDTLRKAVASLFIQGMTNFSGGMIQSLDLLKELDLGGNYIHRVIMLTDGAANCGPEKSKDGILRLLNANREHITCSAFGYGTAGAGQEFDADLLAEFAKQGEGNYAHVENPDLALKAFGTELGGLISTYATGLQLEIKPLNGHMIESVVSDVDTDEEPSGEVLINIPDLLAEETRHIVIAVKLAKQKTNGPRAVSAFDVKVGYQTFDAQGKKEVHSLETKGRVRFVKKDEETNAELDSIVGLAQLVRAQLEAEELAKKGQYAAAEAFLTSQSASFNDRGLDKLAAAASKMGGMVGSAVAYNANHGYLKSFENGATRGLGVSCYAGGSDADLAGLGVQMFNSIMTSTSNAFMGGGIVAPDPAPTAAPALPDLSSIIGGGGFSLDPASAILNTPWGGLPTGIDSVSIVGGYGGGLSVGADLTPGMVHNPSVFGYVPPSVTTVGMPGLQPVSPDIFDSFVPSPVHETTKPAPSKAEASMKKSRKQSRKSW